MLPGNRGAACSLAHVVSLGQRSRALRDAARAIRRNIQHRVARQVHMYRTRSAIHREIESIRKAGNSSRNPPPSPEYSSLRLRLAKDGLTLSNSSPYHPVESIRSVRVRVNAKRISDSNEGAMQLLKTLRNVLILGAIERAGPVDQMAALSHAVVCLFENVQLH
jgi:hypothetical protein